MSNEPSNPRETLPQPTATPTDHFSRPRAILLCATVILSLLLIGWTGVHAKRLGWRKWAGTLGLSATPDRKPHVELAADVDKLAFRGDGRAELGEFSVKLFDPRTRCTLRTDFELEGVTAYKDESSFRKFFGKNHRFLPRAGDDRDSQLDHGRPDRPKPPPIEKEAPRPSESGPGQTVSQVDRRAQVRPLPVDAECRFRAGPAGRGQLNRRGPFHSPITLTNTRFGRRPSNSP